jgi:hypothetical protein
LYAHYLSWGKHVNHELARILNPKKAYSRKNAQKTQRGSMTCLLKRINQIGETEIFDNSMIFVNFVHFCG